MVTFLSESNRRVRDPVGPPGGRQPRPGDEERMEDVIAALAYAKWIKAGKPIEDCEQIWREVERELQCSPRIDQASPTRWR